MYEKKAWRTQWETIPLKFNAQGRIHAYHASYTKPVSLWFCLHQRKIGEPQLSVHTPIHLQLNRFCRLLAEIRTLVRLNMSGPDNGPPFSFFKWKCIFSSFYMFFQVYPLQESSQSLLQTGSEPFSRSNTRRVGCAEGEATDGWTQERGGFPIWQLQRSHLAGELRLEALW